MENLKYRATEVEMMMLMSIVEKLNRSTDSQKIRQSIAEDLLSLLKADMLGSFTWNDRLQQFEDVVFLNMSPANLESYSQYYQYCDPITSLLQVRKEATPVEQVMPQNELERTEFYNDFLRLDGLKWGINLYAYDEKLNVGDLRIWRGTKGTPFGDREVGLLNLLKPHFTNAMINARSVADLRCKVSGWHDLWEYHDQPAIVLDQNHLELHRNDRLRRLLYSLKPEEQQSLISELMQFVRSSGRTNQTWRDIRFALLLAPQDQNLSPGIQMVQMGKRSRLIIDQNWILRRFNVTPTEAEICLLIMRGLSDQTISEKTFRSIWTVRAHTKNIFEKLNVSGRHELAYLITNEVAEIKPVSD